MINVQKSYNWIYVVSLFIFCIVWYAVSKFSKLGEFFLPNPLKVFGRFLLDIKNTQILISVFNTFYESILGSIFGVIIALFLAYFVYKNKIFDKAIHPYIAMSQSIPAIALAPLLLLWFGYGTISIVILCTLMVFFPIFISTLTGLRSIDKNILHASYLDGATGIKLFAYIELPLCLPFLMSGIRNGFVLSITGSVVGEMIMGGNGMGTILAMYKNNLDVVGMFSSVMILGIMSLLIYKVLLFIESKSEIIQSVLQT